MDAEKDALSGTATLDEDDADGISWSPAEYYHSLGMTDEEADAHDLSPDDFEE
jgi:hypothetical protein